jgi:predicted nuclease of predicted toxin-antitoxin system
MRILFDHGTPVPLRKILSEHHVATAFQMGWSRLSNGELLYAAEAEAFDVLITTDQNLRDQQNLSHRKIAITVLRSTSWPRLRNITAETLEAVARVKPGGFDEVPIAD